MSEPSSGGQDPVAPSIRVNAYAGVVDHLRREISLGRIIPGDRLPPERKLAEELGVARETLRQALRVLEGSGQVKIVRGATGGAIVQTIHVDPEMALLELRSRRESLLHLVEYRQEVESITAALSASRRLESDLAAMEQAQSDLAVAADKDSFRRADTRFHLAVAASGKNPYLARAVEDARAEMFYPVDLTAFEFLTESSHSQHDRILQAIRAANPKRAKAAMHDHLGHSREELLRMLER